MCDPPLSIVPTGSQNRSCGEGRYALAMTPGGVTDNRPIHLLRPFYGYEPARLIWPSALGAAALVTAADIVVRLVSPDEKLPLGVLTALIGAPFFVWLILRMRRDA